MRLKIKLDKNMLVMYLGLFLIVILLFLLITNRSYKYTRTVNYVEGIKANETLKVRTYFGKIKKIKIEKEFILDDYYDQYGTYYDAIENFNKKLYSYLKEDLKVSRKGKTISFVISTKHDGVVLDNMTIKQNGIERTALRYNGTSKLDDSSAIKIGEKIDKKLLKKLGYR